MDESIRKMTREAMESAFDALSRKAAAEDLVIDIMVYDESCLVLASIIREASADIDAVYLNARVSEQRRTQELVDQVGRESLRNVTEP